MNKTQKRQRPQTPIRLTKPTPQKSPKEDKTTQGNKNRNRSNIKFSEAKKIVKHPTNIHETKNRDKPDLSLNKTNNPTIPKNTNKPLA